MLIDLIMPYKGMLSGSAELRAQRNVSQDVVVVGGVVSTNSNNILAGVNARVYMNGSYGFASSCGLNKDVIEKVLHQASENAKYMDSRSGAKAAAFPPNPTGVYKTGKTVIPTSQKQMIDFASELDGYIQRKYPKLVGRTVVISADHIEKAIVTNDGYDLYSINPRAHATVQLSIATPDGGVADFSDNIGGPGFFAELFTEPGKLHEEIDKIYEIVRHKSEGIFPNAGVRDVVMSSDLAGILAHEALGHTVEADMVIGGSVAGPNLNKQVADPLISIVDFANEAFGRPVPQPIYVDDEGTLAEDVVIVDKGELKGFMHNRESAAGYGVKPQGNARALSYSDEPLIRMRNTAILPGESLLEDMISSIEDGYYLIRPGNGQADSTGEFMFSIRMGYEIKNGKIGRAIKDTTISGVAFEMLKTVDMVSNDMKWSTSGNCGKKTRIPVGSGGPAIKAKINIGGR